MPTYVSRSWRFDFRTVFSTLMRWDWEFLRLWLSLRNYMNFHVHYSEKHENSRFYYCHWKRSFQGLFQFLETLSSWNLWTKWNIKVLWRDLERTWSGKWLTWVYRDLVLSLKSTFQGWVDLKVSGTVFYVIFSWFCDFQNLRSRASDQQLQPSNSSRTEFVQPLNCHRKHKTVAQPLHVQFAICAQNKVSFLKACSARRSRIGRSGVHAYW